MTRWIQRRAIAWLVLAGCRGDAEADATPTPAQVVERPTVLLAHCQEREADDTCVLGPGPATLRAWIDQQEHAEIRVSIDGAEVPVARRGVDGGLRIELEVPEAARTLTVEGVDPQWSHAYELALVHQPAPAIAAEADALIERDGLDAAAEHLEAALPELPDRDRLAALVHLQGLAYPRQDVLAIVRHGARVIELGQHLGLPLATARAATTNAFVHAYQLGDLAAARADLAVLDALAPTLPEAATWAAFSHGLVARAVGDTTHALESFREAVRMAERLGMYEVLLTAREGLGITYGELGRGSDAVELARRVLEDAQQPGLTCELRFSALNTAGWVQLLLQQRRIEHFPPEELFERALALVEAGGECPIHDQEVNVRINLALDALGDRDPAMALAWLEPVDLVPARFRSWMEEVHARAGLALGRWELVPFPLAGPDPALPRDERWNALVRQAEILEALGMRAAAIDAYVAAEAVVEEGVTAIGVDLGRELYLSGLQASAQGLVRGLVLVGRHDEALCHARLARGRALRMLDRATRLSGAPPEARAAWEADVVAVAELRRTLAAEAADDWRWSSAEQSRRRARRSEQHEAARRRLDAAYGRLGVAASVADCESLPRPADGEVMLVLFPLDEEWLVLVDDGETVAAHAVGELPGEADLAPWAHGVLAGAEAAIEHASRLRILPAGRTWDVPFHALPWKDGVLLDASPVSYALDLAPTERPPLGPSAAVVVADPTMDLPQAREEAAAVAAALEQGKWTVERLEGHDATRPRVEASLARASLLHYAGHGEHGGETGWGARLLLGGGEGLGVSDVLALPRVPDAVVLSGCETGRTTRDTLEGGMNIGRAFVLAGSEWVVAVDRRVSDALSSAVGRGLYDELPAAGWDGAEALRRVQRRLRAAQPEEDWAAFRAVVR